MTIEIEPFVIQLDNVLFLYKTVYPFKRKSINVDRIYILKFCFI